MTSLAIRKELTAWMKTATKVLSLGKILAMLFKLLNVHWSDTTENEQRFDPIPNPKRYLIFAPRWLPDRAHYYLDCGEGSGK
jgi:hypothetical protein